jgi:hypothetical protein
MNLVGWPRRGQIFEGVQPKMPNSIQSEIQARVESFANDLIALIQASALEVVQGALGGSGGVARGRGGRGASAIVSFAQASGGKGQKRDPQLIVAITAKLQAHIAKNPGQRIEEIGKALGTPTKDLTLPVKKLIEGKQIKTRGQRRATTYFPAGAAPKAAKAVPSGRAKKGTKAPKSKRGGRKATEAKAEANDAE